MLEVRAFYEQERDKCHATFEKVEWQSTILGEVTRECPKCQSELVEQTNSENTEQEEIEARCRSCGVIISAESLIENSIIERFRGESYIAMTDGGNAPLQYCPECGLTTYVLGEEIVGCVRCGYVLENCTYCGTCLVPDNVDPENHSQCCYCGNYLAKDN